VEDCRGTTDYESIVVFIVTVGSRSLFPPLARERRWAAHGVMEVVSQRRGGVCVGCVF
jgi:hypothetical protein